MQDKLKDPVKTTCVLVDGTKKNNKSYLVTTCVAYKRLVFVVTHYTACMAEYKSSAKHITPHATPTYTYDAELHIKICKTGGGSACLDLSERAQHLQQGPDLTKIKLLVGITLGRVTKANSQKARGAHARRSCCHIQASLCDLGIARRVHFESAKRC